MNVRPLRVEDAEAASVIQREAFRGLFADLGREWPDPPADRVARWLELLRRFTRTDPDGAYLAEVDGQPAGMAVAIRRGALWGLALLFVHPDHQSAGVGRQLLEATRATAEGAAIEVIQSSPDPRAMRRYARLGLRLHPTVEAAGTVDGSALPTGLPGRLGGRAELDLIDAVDGPLRGSSRAQDVDAVLEQGARLEVVDDGDRRGWAAADGGRPLMLGATDVGTARALLWRCLAGAGDDEVAVHGLTGEQHWAIDVLLDAGLALRPDGAMFLRGLDRLPEPYLPSGIFF